MIAVTHLFVWAPLIKIGKNSIYYYGAHIILVDFFSIFAGKIPGVGSDHFISLVVSIVLVLVIVMALKCGYPLYERIYKYFANYLCK